MAVLPEVLAALVAVEQGVAVPVEAGSADYKIMNQPARLVPVIKKSCEQSQDFFTILLTIFPALLDLNQNNINRVQQRCC